MGTNRRTVLILDHELAFAFWLGQALDQAGYDAFPARNCDDATELIRQLGTSIDLLVVGFTSLDSLTFAESLRRSQSSLKVLMAVGEGDEVNSSLFEADTAQYKPSSAESASASEWLEMVDGLLAEPALSHRIGL